ncbi:hypothetical protein JZ751_026918 [Albula glossodonta]|uniref:Ubiquitin specific peptidase 34 n=1 Tax=Albula glossodonta TaxID=121402 RepID=A0A8T2PL83_9TELE|nr:hypothetical protein JZ751_026918 [Albula glossodonta]
MSIVGGVCSARCCPCCCFPDCGFGLAQSVQGQGEGQVSDADSTDGLQLKKEHALRVFSYISSWTQRQCLCCFKEYKHLEVFNQLVYALINLVISQVQCLRERLCRGRGGEPEWAGSVQRPPPGEDEPLNVERDSAEEDGGGAEAGGLRLDQNQNQSQSHRAKQELGRAGEATGAESPDPFGSWSTEDREKLLLCAAKIFQIQFPLYTAYKHNTHPTIEGTSYSKA